MKCLKYTLLYPIGVFGCVLAFVLIFAILLLPSLFAGYAEQAYYADKNTVLMIAALNLPWIGFCSYWLNKWLPEVF